MPRSGLGFARDLIKSLPTEELAALRRDLAVEPLRPAYKAAIAAAMMVERRLGALGVHSIEAITQLDDRELDTFVDELVGTEPSVRPVVISILEQMVVEVAKRAAVERAARALRLVGQRAEIYMQRVTNAKPLARVRLLRIALEIAPDNKLAALQLGQALEALCDHARATTAFELAARLDPKNAAPRIWLGVAQLQRKRFGRSIRELTHGYQLAGDEHHRYLALHWRARAHLQAGHRDLAAEDVEAALDLCPQGRNAMLVRAQLLEADGMHCEALEVYERCRPFMYSENRGAVDHAIARMRSRTSSSAPSATSTSWSSPTSRDDSNEAFDYEQTVIETRFTLDDYVGRVRERIDDEVVVPWQHPDLAMQLGVSVGAVALFGPYGTGKTMLASAIAGTLKLAFVVISLGNLGSHWYSKTEMRLEGLHKWIETRFGGRALVFLDEVEGLCPAPETSSSSRYREQVGLSVLKMVDALRKMPRVILVVASNRKQLVNQALLRAGRVDIHITMPSPTPDERTQLFRNYTRAIEPAATLDCDRIAHLPYSPAEVAAIGAALARAQLRKRSRGIDIVQADLDAIIAATPPRDLRAYHEHDGIFADSETRVPAGFRRSP